MARSTSDRLKALSIRALLKFGRCDTIGGMRLYVPFGTDEERSGAATKLRYALELLEQFDPVRHARALRDLTAVIVLRDMVAAASIDELTRVSLFNGSEMQTDRRGVATAILLVHESAHAMLIRRGILTNRYARGRLERYCIRCELSFLNKLPAFRGKEQLKEAIIRSAANAVSGDYSSSTRKYSLAKKLLEIGWSPRLVKVLTRSRP